MVISVPLLVQANTELTVLPLTSTGKVWKFYLNCKQCRILGITVNGQHVANYSYADATLRVTPLESKKCVCVRACVQQWPTQSSNTVCYPSNMPSQNTEPAQHNPSLQV